MSLYKALTTEVKGFFEKENVAIDNLVFYFHSKVTVVILITFSTIIAGFEYFGDPIECYNESMGSERNEAKILNVFCWISTTYSVPNLWNASVGDEVVYPGVGNSYHGTSRTYHAYYQWVVFVLYVQAIAFLIPKYLWKSVENNLTSFLAKDLKFSLMKPKSRLFKLKRVADYIEETKNENKSFWFFVFCEMLNLINVISQLYLLDYFLNGKFLSLGKRYLHWALQDSKKSSTSVDHEINVRYDPLLEVFPRMTKCTFYKFGSSGDLERYDAFCILSINHVNEKVFLILWFWLHFLTLTSILYFLWRLGTIFSNDVRIMSLGLSCSISTRCNLEDLVSQCSVTEWFSLKILARNIDERNFDDLCKILLNQLIVEEEVKPSSDDQKSSKED